MVFNFISGLPRAGSTLLAALLKQNPKFHAGITSPVNGLIEALLEEMSAKEEASCFIDDAQRALILRTVFNAYYMDHDDKDVVFDTCRAWTAKLHILNELFPSAKVICCVRDIPDVLDSLERLVRRNPMQPSGVYGYKATGTVYTRVDALTERNGLVGFACDAMRQGCFAAQPGQLLLVRYDTLVQNPELAMKCIYSHIGEEYFEHDFENVVFTEASEFDARLGTPGLHDIRPKVEYASGAQRLPVLPPDLFRKHKEDCFWHTDVQRNFMPMI